MSEKNVKGRTFCIAIAVYVIAKAVINMVLAGSFSLGDLLLACGMACACFVWLKYVNYVIAAVLAIVAIVHLPQNISNIGANWIYLIEGALDIGCAAILCFQSDVKAAFSGRIDTTKI